MFGTFVVEACAKVKGLPLPSPPLLRKEGGSPRAEYWPTPAVGLLPCAAGEGED